MITRQFAKAKVSSVPWLLPSTRQDFLARKHLDALDCLVLDASE
jgi:hypothetical protein